MDYSPLQKVFNQFWWLIPIFIAITVLKSPWFKGVVGESLVRLNSRLRLPSQTYRSFHNVTLPTPDGTTQIDHVIVSQFGIFVIETKHMKGWIFGSEHDAQWTQNLFGQTYRFQNPLRQNYKHLKALEAALEVPMESLHSIVVFSGDCVLKSDLPANVRCDGSYTRFIKSFDQPVFSQARVDELLTRLQARRLTPSLATQRQHVRHLRTRSDPLAERKCPRCGNRMVIRTAKTGRNAGGQFWGCSTYPKCRAVQSVA